MTPLQGAQFTDRDLIEKIVESYYIVDYGFVSKVDDNGTVDVVHAKKLVTMDGQELPETETHGIELLTLACGEFSIKLTPKVGDNVLLLGLKNYVEETGKINHATANDVFLHYQQNTMKALPLAMFNDDAKIKIEIDGGSLALVCSKFVVKGSSDADPVLEVTP